MPVIHKPPGAGPTRKTAPASGSATGVGGGRRLVGRHGVPLGREALESALDEGVRGRLETLLGQRLERLAGQARGG